MQTMTTTSRESLLAMLARSNPAIWEIIHPHVPLISQGFAHHAIGAPRLDDTVASDLNPQPLPPHAAITAEVARATADYARLVITEDLKGERSDEWLTRLVDDWCGTGRPRFPLPWPWPWPPEPDPWYDQVEVMTQIVGAQVLAEFGSRLPEGDLRDSFNRGAGQLFDTAMGR